MRKKYYYKRNIAVLLFLLNLLLPSVLKAQSFTEGFESIGSLNDWFVANNSDMPDQNWGPGNSNIFTAQAGSSTSYVGCGFQSTSSTSPSATISNWLFTPNRVFNNGDVVSFYTRAGNSANYPDRLEVRLSTSGTSMSVGTTPTSVGDFNNLLLSINPNLTTTGYPQVWTQYTITISGLSGPTSGRIAFRYFVTNAGPNGVNSSFVGLDTYSYTAASSSGPDAAVSNVYTLGTIATPWGNGHQVRALIRNTGGVAMSNLPVTLNVSGANTLTNVQNIPFLSPGDSAFVTFEALNNLNPGTNNIMVSVPNDGNNANNSVTVNQTVNNTTFSYLHGTNITGSIGSNTTGIEMIAKFSTNGATTVNQVKLHFTSTAQSYSLRIFQGDGPGGTPGTMIYNSPTQTTSQGENTVSINPPVPVNGDFFVGIHQVSQSTSIGLRYQAEAPLRSGTFFFRVPTTSLQWSDMSPTFPYRLMIETVVNECTPPAQPGLISGATEVCESGQEVYSVDPAGSLLTYEWTLPMGWTGASSTNSITVTAANSSGNISVEAINHCSTSQARSISVNGFANPPEPVISINGSILSSSAATGNQWYWNGNFIPGATGQTYHALVNGNYSVIVTDANGCSATSQAFSLIDLNVSESSLQPEVSLFPNPSKGRVYISLNRITPVKDVHITDLLGKTVKVIPSGEFNTSGNEISFNGKELGEGIYLIRIESESQVIVRKFMIQ